MGGLSTLGDYKVELDAGFFIDEFILGTSELGGTDTLGGSTSFFDVTEYVVAVQIKRGRDSQDAQFGAGTCTLQIDDLKGEDRFSVANQDSPYWNPARGRLGFEPRRKVRISRNNQSIFAGFIQAYDTEFSMDGHNMITVRCADAFSLLSQSTISTFTPPSEKSGARVDRILGLPEVQFPVVPLPIIAEGVANLAELEVSQQTPLAYFNAITQSAEQGRFYIDRSGVFIFEARTPKAVSVVPSTVFADDVSGIRYNTLEVIYE
jgi:hypothetical protein